jgi:hypothetical protein
MASSSGIISALIQTALLLARLLRACIVPLSWYVIPLARLADLCAANVTRRVPGLATFEWHVAALLFVLTCAFQSCLCISVAVQYLHELGPTGPCVCNATMRSTRLESTLSMVVEIVPGEIGLTIWSICRASLFVCVGSASLVFDIARLVWAHPFRCIFVFVISVATGNSLKDL